MIDFNPNAAAEKGNNLFGLPYSIKNSDMVLLPVPWDATASYNKGAAHAPSAIFEASKQVDLFLEDIPEVWKNKVAMLPLDEQILALNNPTTQLINQLENISTDGDLKASLLQNINANTRFVESKVYNHAKKWLQKNKIVGLIGGEHSVSFGLVKALAEEHSFSVLQIDAHADLRKAYQGIAHSHASIMYNLMALENVNNITQVGVRDLCEEEMQRINESNGKIKMHSWLEIENKLLNGEKWTVIIQDIVANLNDKVYISFDVDGLDPSLCPNTGTPVPGGLSFYQAIGLIYEIIVQKKQIIGFDLVEVVPSKHNNFWDANVGARLLFHLVQRTFQSNKV